MACANGERSRNYALDIIKFIAALLMVFHHFQQVMGGSFRYINFYGGRFYYGYAVELFFVISGYLLYPYVQRVRCGLGFARFMGRKLKRLLPLTAITAVFYEIAYIVSRSIRFGSPKGELFTLWGTLLSAFGLNAGGAFNSPDPSVNNPCWFVAVLLICYALFYIECRLARRLRISPVWLFAATVLLGCGVRSYGIELPFLNGYSARGYHALFFGLILAHALANGKPRPWAYALSIACFIGLPALVVFAPDFVSQGMEYLFTFLFCSAVILLAASPAAQRLFKMPWLGALGRISFNIYLWHAGFLVLLKLLSAAGALGPCRSLGAMLLFALAMVAVGTASYYLIERPIEKRLGYN